MKKYTKEDFIIKASKLHECNYSYNNVIWDGVKTKIIITCPIHGDFEQRPDHHLQGHGCTKCKYETIKSKTSKKEEFYDRAFAAHKLKYDYSLVNYKSAHQKIDIICDEHGTFSQTPNAHIRGQGCPDCGLLSQVSSRTHCGGWKHSDWELAGNMSKEFEGFSLYIIKCFNGDEEFIKIGKTYRNIHKRFGYSYNMPYNYLLLSQFFGSSKYISELEVKLLSVYKAYQYMPKIEFPGMTECIEYAMYENVERYIKTELD